MAIREDRDFDWIDDSFDDKRTAADMEKAKGPKAAGVLLVVVVALSLALVAFTVAAALAVLG